jgi:hypothetical protein
MICTNSFILAFTFQEIKVGLWNHTAVCVSLCLDMYPPNTLGLQDRYL